MLVPIQQSWVEADAYAPHHTLWRKQAMCYNCGCGMPNNDMGNTRNITHDDIIAASDAMNTPIAQALANIEELARKVAAAQEIRREKDWKP